MNARVEGLKHRVLPFAAGAAAAVVLELLVLNPPAPRAQVTEPIAEPKRVPVVAEPRAIEPEPSIGQKAEPLIERPAVPPTRSPSKKSPPLPPSEVEDRLKRAAAGRGLELADLDKRAELKPLTAKLKTAQRSGDARDIEDALKSLLDAIALAKPSAEAVARKLAHVKESLERAKGQLEPAQLSRLEQRYLDVQSELSGASPERLRDIWVTLDELSKDVREAKRGGSAEMY